MNFTKKLMAGLERMFVLRDEGKCPMCEKQGPFQFKDPLSVKEHGISGLCQECQDKAFAKEED